MLLMALPNEHLLTFSQYKDAKTWFEAIQARFSGNDATKKTQRTLLKQMYENFNAPSTESFDSIFIRLQKIISQLAILVSAISTPVKTVSSHDNTANLSDATVYAFLENQPNGSQLVHEDLEQIHDNDLEEMDLKWQLALLSMRARRYFQKTGKKITINGSDTIRYDKTKAKESRQLKKDCDCGIYIFQSNVAIDGAGFDWSYMADDEVPTNMALMDFSDSEVHNSKTCSNTCLKSFETLKTQYDNLRIEFNKSEFDLAIYKRGLAYVEEQRVFYKKNEVVFCDQIAVLKRDASFRDSEITALNLQIEKLKKEKESNQIKIDNFKNASKSLDKLIGSQITDNSKTRLGFTSYNVVVPPPTGLFAPPSIDLSNSVLTKSGIILISTARQSSSRAATPVSAARPINTAASKPLVNVAKPSQNALQTTHSLSKRPFYQQTSLKNKILNNNVNAAKVNSVNTAKENKVTSAIGNQGIIVVKSSTCWVWRPKIKVHDHVSKNSGSYICKRFNYVDPEGRLKHMIGNISYITDFKEYDGGYVAFGGGAKGGKITGKGTIRTGKLDFEDVYFVKELQFNLFSVSQMCEKKNSVLFTDTECFVLSPNFKVLVVKPHFKTPYELFKGRTPALSFMTSFGCHVLILNTLAQLGKFDGKSDEEIFVGYSTTSKAFRVYNIRTRKVEENPHITFLKNKHMIVGTNSNDFAGKGASFDVDGHNKDKHGPSQASESYNQYRPNAESNTKTVNTATPIYADYPNDPLMHDLEDAGIFDDAYDDRNEGAEADYNNLETIILVSPIPSIRIHKDHPKEHIIGEMEPKKVTQALDDESWVEAMQEELIQFKLLNV
uniref:Retrovirus-related Pol polyprotein from transposon TNT 1-94 n=1 Tax=Tanacetum cinerariifolium TaxID=118510 RepID=A0A6L2KL09_TANCI|nr:retrovirus-related Pol polyprotein from transposon TNT 1-94 [Tanacetum cinerariifolium]